MLDDFKKILQEAVISLPANFFKKVNADLGKAGFDGTKIFRNENDSFAQLDKVLQRYAIGIDPIKWENLIVTDTPSGEIPIRRLDEYGKKIGTFAKHELAFLLDKQDRYKLSIVAEINKK